MRTSYQDVGFRTRTAHDSLSDSATRRRLKRQSSSSLEALRETTNSEE
jgi:hypothetical protein